MFENILKGRRKTMTELEDENEHLEMELSVAQKRQALKELSKRGLSREHFGRDEPGTWRKIIQWLKTH